MLKIGIYQIEEGERLFECYTKAMKKGIEPSDYRCVYRGFTESQTLEEVFTEFNLHFHGTMQGRSLSVGDVVEIMESEDTAVKGCYYCDSIGFVRLPDFNSALCREMNGIRVLMLQPGMPPIETKVVNTLSFWQRAVSGQGEPSLIEVSGSFADNAVLIGDEEAKLKQMKGNRQINGAIYAGTVYVAGVNKHGDFCSLTEKQIERYSKEFQFPEDISDEMVKRDIFIGFCAL